MFCVLGNWICSIELVGQSVIKRKELLIHSSLRPAENKAISSLYVAMQVGKSLESY